MAYVRPVSCLQNSCQRQTQNSTTCFLATVLINGPEERTIPGNALSVHPDLPFRGLERFGVSFLSRFEGSQLPSSVLRSVTLVDTPGVLSGEKQRVNRGYDFTKVVAWFAERADLILLLFDAHKLDISDELKGKSFASRYLPLLCSNLPANDNRLR